MRPSVSLEGMNALLDMRLHNPAEVLGPQTIVQDAKRFICSSLLVHAFLSIGHPIATCEAHYFVPRDFENPAGFELVQAAPG